MKKLIEYLTIALSIGGTLCLVGAVGAIDGGYNGIPMNDNWGACFVLAGLGITMFILALYSQELYKETK
jgi:putative Mn2+ efflux pump MntP|tara:strand:+ start:372 stop:578 length:207 start_codon:yes stop_codon:yes gene_type:complete